jgi:O-antigen ligase
MNLRPYFARAGAAVPALLLALAVAAGGLRSQPEWLVFGGAFLLWEVFRRRGTSAAGLEAALLFFAWLGAAALFSAEPAVSLVFFARYAVLGLLFFSAASSEDGAGAWLGAVYAVGGAAAAVFLLQRAAGLYAAGLIGGNPNYSAVFCAAAFAPALLGLSDPQGRRRPALAALCLLLAAGIAVSGSRGAAAAGFLAGAAGLAAARRWRWLAAFSLAAAAGLAFLPAAAWSGLLKLGDPRAFARPLLWGSALRAAAASPLLGWGPGLFGKVFELFKFPYFDGIAYYGHSTLHAHGELFNLAAEAGFPAAAFFALAAAQALASGGIKKLPLKLCALAALLQGSADMIFYSGAVSLLFWGSLGYGAAGRAGVPAGRKLRAALAACCFALLALPALLPFADGRAAFASAGYREASAGRSPVLALALLRSAELDAPKDPFIAEAEGRGLAASSDPAGAAAAFRRALELEPGFAGARLGLAELYAGHGPDEEACAGLPVPYAGPAPKGRYQEALTVLDAARIEKLRKELCKKRRTGGATAPGRKTR